VQKQRDEYGYAKGSRITMETYSVFPTPESPMRIYQGQYRYYPMRYNFETGIWSNDQGEKFKNGTRVE
jgi:hypothetical protein